MAVFRIEKTRDYTVMSNHHLKDRTLTLKSKGLLSMMLSLPDELELHHAEVLRRSAGKVWTASVAASEGVGRPTGIDPAHPASG